MTQQKASLFNYDGSQPANVVVLGLGYDRTASFQKGMEHAPDKIAACLDEQIETYVSEHDFDLNDVLCVRGDKPARLYDNTPEQMVDVVRVSAAAILGEQPRPFIMSIGGDHSVSNGVFQALAAVHNPADVTILHIDAHLDLRDTDDFNRFPYGKWSHACVMRRAAELGYQFCHVGVRAFSKEEHAFAVGNGHGVFSWKKPMAHQQHSHAILQSITTQKVYISFDVDGLDPSVMPGTGTPVQGGLSWKKGLEIIREAFRLKTVIAADLVEVMPIPGTAQSEMAGAELVREILLNHALALKNPKP